MAEFRESIDIDAAPETVFAYLTTDAGMQAWMGQHAELNPTPGGTFAVDIAGHPVRGTYLHVEHPSRVVVSWGFAGSDDLPAGASTVEFLLTAIGTGTRVDLCHSNLPDAEVRGHANGWANFLPRLAVVGAGGNAGSDDWVPLTECAQGWQMRKDVIMTHDNAYAVVKKYHYAWTNGDVNGAMNYVADDITCQAPGVDLDGKVAYREFISGFAPQLTGIGKIAEFVDKDRVALFYYPQTASTSTTPAAELFTIRDGKISESILIFDRLSYGRPEQS
ncbi:SRPBCC domain-containing protein [Paramicrobacterium fandaimingii]|uniref:SRPBCC domain-containing protein n=1 Tax=Paramicrobacterium fandaimingii TaxID=2708079 RepID=UPI0014246031|nr:SRPBCC domain-containing protein [Microbacterium fandaimingii]